MSMQWHENVDWDKYKAGIRMGNSVQPPEPEQSGLEEMFRAIGRSYGAERMRQAQLMTALVDGFTTGIREAVATRGQRTPGSVDVTPDVCPDCGEAWRYKHKDWATAPDSVISTECPNRHRWRFAAEKLTDRARGSVDVDLPEPTGETDDGNGMVTVALPGGSKADVPTDQIGDMK